MFYGSLTGNYYVESNPILFTFCPENKRDMSVSSSNTISNLRLFISKKISKVYEERDEKDSYENDIKIEKLELASELDFNSKSLVRYSLDRKSHDMRNIQGMDLEYFLYHITNVERFKLVSDMIDMYQNFWIELSHNYRLVIHIQKDE